ncbi:MAG: hypothetical protein AB8E15_09105 [Bdellovibrionales bacterium]
MNVLLRMKVFAIFLFLTSLSFQSVAECSPSFFFNSCFPHELTVSYGDFKASGQIYLEDSEDSEEVLDRIKKISNDYIRSLRSSISIRKAFIELNPERYGFGAPVHHLGQIDEKQYLLISDLFKSSSFSPLDILREYHSDISLIDSLLGKPLGSRWELSDYLASECENIKVPRCSYVFYLREFMSQRENMLLQIKSEAIRLKVKALIYSVFMEFAISKIDTTLAVEKKCELHLLDYLNLTNDYIFNPKLFTVDDLVFQYSMLSNSMSCVLKKTTESDTTDLK